jgi:KDO2-lipid IV(A) lauroyltransferase
MVRPRPMIIKSKYPSSQPRFRDYPQPRYWPAWIIIGIFRFFGLLPQRLIWHLGMLLGEIAFHVHRTPTIKTNLEMCFPELTLEERERLRRRYYHNIGRAFFGLGTAWYASARRMRRLVRVNGMEHLERALAGKQGVLLLAPHFLCLEMGGIAMSMYISEMGNKTIGLYRKPRNPLLHQALRYNSNHLGGEVIERYENLKVLVKAMREGCAVYYLPDQDPDRPGDDYVFAPFFGVPAATYTAFAKLARLGRATVIPMSTRILPGAKGYEVDLLQPMENFPTGDDQKDAERVNVLIEEMVRQSPDQYLWSYRRFKTRPGGAPSPYVRKR